MTAADTGRLGETAAAEHYRRDGYTLIAQNYKSRFGELDLVLEKGGGVVIAEVKARGENAIALPREWVTAAKQQKIILATQRFLQAKGLYDAPVRFDVVEVTFDHAGLPVVNRIENAFIV